MTRREVARLARLGAGSLCALSEASSAAAAAQRESVHEPHAARRLREFAAGSFASRLAAPRVVPWGGVLSMRSFGTQAGDGGTFMHYDGGKLASLRMDTPFKRAFNKPATLSHFLNAVLNDDTAHRVVAINNVEVNSTITRSIIFDVHCTLANGSKVVIELQKANMRSQLVDRLVGYLGNAYVQQWKPGGKTLVGKGYSLVPVRMVAVIDFSLVDPLADPPEAKGSLVANASACLRAGELPASIAARFRELLDITIVQLPLAPASAERDAPAAALWAHLLRHSEEYTVSTLPEALRAEPFMSAAVSARVDAMSVAEREALEVEENHVRDTARAATELEAAKQHAEREKERADDLARQVAKLTKMLRDGAGAAGGGKLT